MPDADQVVGPETTVIEADGQVVIPGFIDAHTHLDTFQSFEQAYPAALAGGTTTVITETDRFAKRFGAEGVREFLDATDDLPVAVFGTVPASMFYDDVAGVATRDIDRDALLDLADDDRVVGVGEVFWNWAIDHGPDNPMADLLASARDAEGAVWGHGAGCHDGKLGAFASVADNDHEALSAADVVERVERGMTVIARYGSIRDDVVPVVDALDDIPTTEICLCSDSMWPDDLVSEGYMNRVVQRVIDAGVPPTTAFRMATLNAARHLDLRDRGSLSPGSVADIVVLDEPEQVTVDTVVSSGELVVRDGILLVDGRTHDYPAGFTVDVTVDVTQETFRIPAPDDREVRAIEYDSGLLSRMVSVKPPRVDGELQPDPDRDLLKGALLPDGTAGVNAGFTGFVTGLGLRTGAVATSETWNHPSVLVVGAEEASMVGAVERVADLGGGWVVAHEGEPVAELPTPIAGSCAATPLETTSERMHAVRDRLASQGTTVDQPLLAVGTLSAIGMPWFKLGTEGYVDVIANEVVELIPEAPGTG